MEMEDHHPHRQHDYVMPDLMQFMTTHPQFPAAPGGITQPAPAAELFPGHHRNCLTQQHHFEMLMMPQGLQDFADGNNNNNNNNNSTSNNNTVTASAAGVSTPSFSTGFDGEAAGGAGATAYFGGDGGNGRWPRQETLTLLEIRSRLDSKFKEANQKGPVWDEVSRVMCEEHGYQRSGKKCREKFENLYKYYKKTKEGKAGRQDGKHYRFFRQLEALCGGDHHTTNNTSPNSLQETCTHPLGISSSTTTIPFNPSITAHPHHHQELSFPSSSRQNPFVAHQNSLSLSDHNSSSGPDSLSSPSDNELSTMEITDSAEKIKWDKKKKRRSGWKAKIKEFIDLQMKKLVEKQEAWLERLTRTLELKEQERVLREEEWRRQEQARIDREHKFWAKQRAWIEARDAALMETLHTFTGIEQLKAPAVAQAADVGDDGDGKVNGGGIISNGNRWTDGEITKLIQTRTSMETRFQQQISDDDSEELALWEEVANQMIGLGFKKNASMCKNKWDWINNYKKSHNNTNYYSRSSSNCGYLQSSESFLHSQGTTSETASGASARQLLQLNHHDNINGSSSLAARAASNSNNNTSNSVSVSDSCFRFLMADNGDHHLWEGYGLKLSSLGSDHHQ